MVGTGDSAASVHGALRGEARSADGDEAGDREAGEGLAACAGERNADAGDEEAGKKTARPGPGRGRGRRGRRRGRGGLGRGRGRRGGRRRRRSSFLWAGDLGIGRRNACGGKGCRTAGCERGSRAAFRVCLGARFLPGSPPDPWSKIPVRRFPGASELGVWISANGEFLGSIPLTSTGKNQCVEKQELFSSSFRIANASLPPHRRRRASPSLRIGAFLPLHRRRRSWRSSVGATPS